MPAVVGTLGITGFTLTASAAVDLPESSLPLTIGRSQLVSPLAAWK